MRWWRRFGARSARPRPMQGWWMPWAASPCWPAVTTAVCSSPVRAASCETSFASWVSLRCFPRSAPLGIEVRRQAEERKQPLGVEKEDEVGNPAVPDLDHLERPRIEPAAWARLVLAERRAAVGAARGHQARSLASDAGALPPGEDVIAALEPHVVRRHRLPGVLAD